jgi:MoaD family protein
MPLIKLFANLPKVAGTKEVSITGESIKAVLVGLVRQYPALDRYLLEDEHIRPHLVITLNGHPTQDSQAPVSEEDEIAIFPPIAGG